MELQETGLLAARDIDSMDSFTQRKWEMLTQVLPGTRFEDARPQELSEVDWDAALLWTALNRCTEDEIYEYFVALRRYYPSEDFQALLEHVNGHLPRAGIAGDYLRRVKQALIRLLTN